MAPTATFGVETGNAHFGRAAFPLQGWLSMTNNLTEGEERKPIKLVTHFIAENGIAANHHFTLTAFAQWLDLQVTEDQYDSSRLEKLVLLSDGSSSQNWYYLLLHSLHFNHHIGLTTFLGIWFGSLTIWRSVPTISSPDWKNSSLLRLSLDMVSYLYLIESLNRP